MKTVNIGIIGLGVVGKGVYEAIRKNGDLISRKTGVSLAIKGVCDKDKKALAGISAGDVPVRTSSADDLIKDDDIDIIVELIGGIDPARGIIRDSLAAGKNVVTANKALLSEHWEELFRTASENRVFLNFEASVGGAIPVIRAIRESFVANRIDTMYGILNGTTNFILSMMAEKGASFEEALKIAQEKGIAEADPDLDISGKDSAHKLTLLSLLGFGARVSLEDVYTEGISAIEPQDIKNAERWGYSLKLLAIAKDRPGGLQLRVHPTLLPAAHILSDIEGTDNAVFIKGDLIGEGLLFGKGAGKEPTSSSVVGDIVDIARHLAYFCGENPCPYNMDFAQEDVKIRKVEDLEISYYLRFSVIDKPGVLAGISSVLAESEISIASVTQDERNEGETVPVIILTHLAGEGNMKKAIARIDSCDYVTAKTVAIRIEE